MADRRLSWINLKLNQWYFIICWQVRNARKQWERNWPYIEDFISLRLHSASISTRQEIITCSKEIVCFSETQRTDVANEFEDNFCWKQSCEFAHDLSHARKWVHASNLTCARVVLLSTYRSSGKLVKHSLQFCLFSQYSVLREIKEVKSLLTTLIK